MSGFELGRLTKEERELWQQVDALWRLSVARDTAAIAGLLHPDYVGWVIGTGQPHDFAAALASVGPSSPHVLRYVLHPLSVKVFDGVAGVAHYAYEADIEDEGQVSKTVKGRWSEMYVRTGDQWRMISVSGGPDGQR